ncbi:MAG TPA: hypothetical protein VHB98_20400 [Chloroflexota bacterium]|nr:hypothetical protein [Chloroflexota bacterium]
MRDQRPSCASTVLSAWRSAHRRHPLYNGAWHAGGALRVQRALEGPTRIVHDTGRGPPASIRYRCRVYDGLRWRE